MVLTLRTAVALVIVLFSALSSDPAVAAVYNGWQSHTSTSQVRYMDYFDDSLHVVTSGGWLRIDPSTGGMKKLTNNDGLGTNDLHYVMKDSSGAVWLAGFGRLIRSVGDELTPFLFFDGDNNLMPLYTIADDGEQLWVGTSTGLALFAKNIDGGQIEDFYFRFGDFSAQPAVKDILLLGDTIWIATSDGLAVADKSDPDLLKSFASWTTLRPSDLGGSTLDTVTALAFYRGNLYMGTTADVFRLEMTSTDTTLVDILTRPGINVKHMIVERDSLFIYAGGGFFIYNETSTWWNYTPAIPDWAFSSGRIVDTVHWLGDYVSGIYYGSDTLFFKYDDGGLPGNHVVSLSSDSEGGVAGGFGVNGVAAFDGTGWDDRDFARIGHGITSVLHDNDGNIWAGSWGDGLSLIKDDTVITFKEDNSTLHGVSDLHSYVVVNGLTKTSDYIFILNIAARDANPVRVVDMNDLTRWGSFGFQDGLTIEDLTSIDTYDGVFVAGSEDNGVVYYYYGPDPFDKSDDSVVVMRESNSWLSSDNVRAVGFDSRGTLYAGTKYGLSKYDAGIDRFVNVTTPIGFGPDVSELAFERRGIIWIGSHNGLSRYNIATGSIDVFTTLNSGLADDDIMALMVNSKTSDLWIGTGKGISVLESSIGPPESEIEKVIAFPNPFIIQDGAEVLSFNYDGVATVRIYTVNGELVKETDTNIPWDGRNQQQAHVSSGVYLLLLTAEDGSVGRGKILLIRK